MIFIKIGISGWRSDGSVPFLAFVGCLVGGTMPSKSTVDLGNDSEVEKGIQSILRDEGRDYTTPQRYTLLMKMLEQSPNVAFDTMLYEHITSRCVHHYNQRGIVIDALLAQLEALNGEPESEPRYRTLKDRLNKLIGKLEGPAALISDGQCDLILGFFRKVGEDSSLRDQLKERLVSTLHSDGESIFKVLEETKSFNESFMKCFEYKSASLKKVKKKFNDSFQILFHTGDPSRESILKKITRLYKARQEAKDECRMRLSEFHELNRAIAEEDELKKIFEVYLKETMEHPDDVVFRSI